VCLGNTEHDCCSFIEAPERRGHRLDRQVGLSGGKRVMCSAGRDRLLDPETGARSRGLAHLGHNSSSCAVPPKWMD